MVSAPSGQAASPARLARRAHITEAARALVGARVDGGFDPVRAPLCAIDVVMVAGSPWLKDGLERDFAKDESGYRKIGGGANTPAQAYFFRSGGNLVHYLKRAGFYVPRGGTPQPVPGMACFFDWDEGTGKGRGRFNFTPDRSGIILDVKGQLPSKIVLATFAVDGDKTQGFLVKTLDVEPGGRVDRALIGWSDLP